MSNRIELNEAVLDSVVGGAFNYNTHKKEDGSEYMTCRVDGVGTYYCSTGAKRAISLYFMNHESASAADAVQYALDNGYFWN